MPRKKNNKSKSKKKKQATVQASPPKKSEQLKIDLHEVVAATWASRMKEDMHDAQRVKEALVHLLDMVECEHDNHHEQVVRAGAIQAVVEALNCHEKIHNLMGLSLGFLVALLRKDEHLHAARALEESGGIRAVAQVMKRHDHQIGIQMIGETLLFCLIEKQNLVDSVVKQGGVSAIVGAMKRLQQRVDKFEFVSIGWEVILNHFLRNEGKDEIHEAMENTGVVSLFVDMLKRYGKDESKETVHTLSQSCAAIAFLATNRDSVNLEFAELGGIPEIVTAMERHRKDASFATVSLHVIEVLCSTRTEEIIKHKMTFIDQQRLLVS